MHFTLVFDDLNLEGPAVSVSLVFHPNVIWRIGEWQLIPKGGPEYELGFIDELEVSDGGLLTRISSDATRDSVSVTVICHPNGHGAEKDLALLLDDLRGYKVKVVRLEE